MTHIHYLGPRVGRIPLASMADVQAAADGGLLEETQWVELKEKPSPSSKPTNAELAKDLASLSLHGGVLIYGVKDKTFEVVGCDTSGLVDRIAQVASMSVHPPLSPVVYPLTPCGNGPEHGVLVVEVPASAQAPHMVDGSYWGRSSNGKRRLSDPEVRVLMQSRTGKETEFREHLMAMVGQDPLARSVAGHPSGNSHIYLFAQPTTTVLGRSDDFDFTSVVRNAIHHGQAHGTLADLNYARRDPLGLAFSTNPDGEVERKWEDFTSYLLLRDEDSSLEFVSGGGSLWRASGPDGRSDPREAVGSYTIAISTWEFLDLVRQVSLEHWGYSGEWRVGIHITNLGGKALSFNDFRRRGEVFPREEYTSYITIAPAAWQKGQSEFEARRLLVGFLRAIDAEQAPLESLGAW